MTDFLIAINAAILSALEQIADFRTVDVWQGDMEDLLKNAQKLPSAHVIFSAAEFGGPTTIGARVAPADMVWSVIVMSQNLRDRKSGALDSLSLLAKVLASATPAEPTEPKGLTRLNTGHGWLWPVKVQFIGAENGKSAYGIHFEVRKEQR